MVSVEPAKEQLLASPVSSTGIVTSADPGIMDEVGSVRFGVWSALLPPIIPPIIELISRGAPFMDSVALPSLEGVNETI